MMINSQSFSHSNMTMYLTFNFLLFYNLLPSLIICTIYLSCAVCFVPQTPVVINTWSYNDANAKAWERLSDGGTVLDSLVEGLAVCEQEQCDFTVGFGGSPDENGETTLDALIMDGTTINVGAVASLRRMKSAIAIARHVLVNTQHSLLVGDAATEFAKKMGFKEESLQTNRTKELFNQWIANKCQPNFWENVEPDPLTSCGPYRPLNESNHIRRDLKRRISQWEHDTIGMVVVDQEGHVAAGTSTNGATFKIPGRVGDSPLPGAGAYADDEVGGAATTGDGDVMLRFLPSFLAVEEMRRGATPLDAAKAAIKRITRRYATFQGAVVAVRKDGKFAAACHNLLGGTFPYVVSSGQVGTATVFYATCS